MKTFIKIQDLDISLLDKDSLPVQGVQKEEIELILITKQDAEALQLTQKMSTWQINEARSEKEKLDGSPLQELKEIAMTLVKGATIVSNIFPSFKQSSLYEIKAGSIEEVSNGRFKLSKINLITD